MLKSLNKLDLWQIVMIESVACSNSSKWSYYILELFVSGRLAMAGRSNVDQNEEVCRNNIIINDCVKLSCHCIANVYGIFQHKCEGNYWFIFDDSYEQPWKHFDLECDEHFMT